MYGSGRGLILDTIPALDWKNWGKPQKTSVSLAGLRAEIWMQDNPDFQNRKQEF
jgi:hypothetical protein